VQWILKRFLLSFIRLNPGFVRLAFRICKAASMAATAPSGTGEGYGGSKEKGCLGYECDGVGITQC